MTDQTNAPISVTASGTKVVSKETLKNLFLAGFVFAADRFMHSESAIVVVVGVSGSLAGAAAVYCFGLLERIHNWRCLKHAATHAPDEVAVVGPISK